MNKKVVSYELIPYQVELEKYFDNVDLILEVLDMTFEYCFSKKEFFEPGSLNKFLEEIITKLGCSKQDALKIFFIVKGISPIVTSFNKQDYSDLEDGYDTEKAKFKIYFNAISLIANVDQFIYLHSYLLSSFLKILKLVRFNDDVKQTFYDFMISKITIAENGNVLLDLEKQTPMIQE